AKKCFENFHDKIHWRVVIVEHDHLVHGGRLQARPSLLQRQVVGVMLGRLLRPRGVQWAKLKGCTHFEKTACEWPSGLRACAQAQHSALTNVKRMIKTLHTRDRVVQGSIQAQRDHARSDSGWMIPQPWGPLQR